MVHRAASGNVALTPDGHQLSYEVSGDPFGWPVFLLHGMPGSRIGPKPRGSVLYRLGVRLISYDRPGYGGSTRRVDRLVADAATDVRAIADQLELTEFAIVGRSAGGPHALACAARLPQVTRTAVLVSLAPAQAAGLDWYTGMTDDNIDSYSTGDTDLLVERIRLRADRTQHNPETLLTMLAPDMTLPDRRVTTDVAIRRQLIDAYAEATRPGPYGWIDDALALRKDWGFDLDKVKGPVLLWHGAEDNFSPVSHSRWLTGQISGAVMRMAAGAAHFGAVEQLPEILAWTKLPRDLSHMSTDRPTDGLTPAAL